MHAWLVQGIIRKRKLEFGLMDLGFDSEAVFSRLHTDMKVIQDIDY
ncbi:MAG: hypothetical protein ACI85I_002499 [Arenicella sp.]